MARKPNYKFDRLQRERQKAEKKAEKARKKAGEDEAETEPPQIEPAPDQQ